MRMEKDVGEDGNQSDINVQISIGKGEWKELPREETRWGRARKRICQGKETEIVSSRVRRTDVSSGYN